MSKIISCKTRLQKTNLLAKKIKQKFLSQPFKLGVFLMVLSTGINFSQTIKVRENSTGAVILKVTDEGTTGSIHLSHSTPLPNQTQYKLYRTGHSLFWDGTPIVAGSGPHSLDAADGDPMGAVFVDGDGHVGIGTMNPAGAAISIEDDANHLLKLESTLASGAYPFVSFFQSGSYAAYLQSKNNDFDIRNVKAGKLHIGTNNTNDLTIASNGDVGIGIDDPNLALQIYSGTQNTKVSIQNTASYIYANDGLELSIINNDAFIKNQESGNFHLGTNNTTDLTIESGGEVGIGTTSPDHKLHVIDSDATGAVGKFENTISSTSAYGVFGSTDNTDGFGYGGYFEGGFAGAEGIVTPNSSADNTYYGLYGYVKTEDAFVGNGRNYGVAGYVQQSGWNYGVIGYVGGNVASSTNYAVYGFAEGTGTNYAGFFSTLDINGHLSKSSGGFKIDHPLDPANKYLYHSFVESPDMLNIYNGNVKLDGFGEAVVELPDWFEPLNRDFKYHITAIGAPGPNLYIAEEISGTSFRIGGGEGGMKESWQVTGIRQDDYANANRIPIEEDKPLKEQGKYMHPEDFGMPKEMSITNQIDKVVRLRSEK